ncbi:MAG: class I SAM-dependent methyltransferase [Verrucomicrobia bacterium]|nr:class I SAM-dependent methyltransferase [Verrucomicrobiota bacterium]
MTTAISALTAIVAGHVGWCANTTPHEKAEKSPTNAAIHTRVFRLRRLSSRECSRFVFSAFIQIQWNIWWKNCSPYFGSLLPYFVRQSGDARTCTRPEFRSVRSDETKSVATSPARIASDPFKKAGGDDLVTVIEGDAHETVRQHKDPIDILFLDADKEGYIGYLQKLLPLVRPGGLIVAHNMKSPRPDPRYIEAITTNPDLDSSLVLMEGAGIGLTLKKR